MKKDRNRQTKLEEKDWRRKTVKMEIEKMLLKTKIK